MAKVIFEHVSRSSPMVFLAVMTQTWRLKTRSLSSLSVLPAMEKPLHYGWSSLGRDYFREYFHW